jgi:hypothetical protein
MSTRLSALRIVFVMVTFTVFFVPLAHAQKNDPPIGQFGIGVYAINSLIIPSGLEGVYAFNPNVQVGSEVSLGVTSAGGASATKFFIGPFARYLFASTVSPFVQGGLQILTGTGSQTGIFLGAGVAYNINHEIGLHASVDVLNIAFTNPSVTTFGWSIIRADADWFF